jgi:hypothetical protein
MARWILNPSVAVAIAVVTLTSCGAEWHLKRAIAKDPTLVRAQPVRFDTIVVTKERKLTDTIVMRDRDTITIEKDRVRVRLVRSYDTLMVEGTCLPDTIRIDVIREIPQVVQEQTIFGRGRGAVGAWLGFVALVFSIVFVVFRWNDQRRY